MCKSLHTVLHMACEEAAHQRFWADSMLPLQHINC